MSSANNTAAANTNADKPQSTVSPMFVEALCSLFKGCVVPESEGPVTVFYGETHLSIEAYVKRLVKYSYAQEEDIIVAVILLDRLGYRYPACKLSFQSFHRTFLTALVTSIKSRQDMYYTNTFYSHVGGVSLAQFNTLEREFLLLLDFDVFVGETEFSDFCSAICQLYPFGEKLDKYASASTSNTPTHIDERSSDAMSADGYQAQTEYSNYDDAMSYKSYSTYQTVPFYPSQYPQDAYYPQKQQYTSSPQDSVCQHTQAQAPPLAAAGNYSVWYGQTITADTAY
ncbi:hypothetical protein DIPPA_15902 [Diplonema papillatum]|nr:hypothetical protein DIPPA_15902 [Diplonema papillatum]|eukprot:gene12444-19242_t